MTDVYTLLRCGGTLGLGLALAPVASQDVHTKRRPTNMYVQVLHLRTVIAMVEY